MTPEQLSAVLDPSPWRLTSKTLNRHRKRADYSSGERGTSYTVGGRHFDALIFGYWEGDKLMYAARTRSGFTPVVREQLHQRFRGLETPECPFANLPEARAGRLGEPDRRSGCRWRHAGARDGTHDAPIHAPKLETARREIEKIATGISFSESIDLDRNTWTSPQVPIKVRSSLLIALTVPTSKILRSIRPLLTSMCQSSKPQIRIKPSSHPRRYLKTPAQAGRACAFPHDSWCEWIVVTG